MPLPESERIKFFVFVIESPSAVDLYHRRSEGDIIRQAVNLNGIPCYLLTAINIEAFEAALRIGLPEAMEANPGRVPILHISAHGFQEGIQLSNSEILLWARLRQLLLPINKELSNALLVCLSSCEGYAGTRMAMYIEDDGYPFFALIANAEKPLWSETAIAYSTFYHWLARGEYVLHALDAMRVASGNKTFFAEMAHESRQGYINYIQSLNAEAIQTNLEKQAVNDQSGNSIKLRKYGLNQPS
ncbi:MAG: hypothetical protein HY823_01850 [Acidobacteria bacterium]|nr:hypothetical protein [Acidobacteriota bacterium]